MKEFTDWIESVSPFSAPSIDGKPLEPHTIYGAESQIKALASSIATTFKLDPKYQQHRQQIDQAVALMHQAANMLGNVMSGEERHAPHQFHQ